MTPDCPAGSLQKGEDPEWNSKGTFTTPRTAQKRSHFLSSDGQHGLSLLLSLMPLPSFQSDPQGPCKQGYPTFWFTFRQENRRRRWETGQCGHFASCSLPPGLGLLPVAP